ncbi:MAG: TadE family protein [Mycobacteriales bacterium]|nr:pilus assembly protein [Frankia sp.]
MRRSDRGAAVVEFVLVGVLLIFLFLGVLQVGLVLHMRNVVVASAAEAARAAASADVESCTARPRAHDLVAAALSARVADALRYDEAACEEVETTGRRVVVVRVRGTLPMLLLPVLPSRTVRLDVTAHALKEGA